MRTLVVSMDRLWLFLLSSSFALLNLRFVFAILAQEHHTSRPSALLFIGALALGIWRPLPALFAFTVFSFFLTGIAEIGLIECPAPSTFILATLFLGIGVNNHIHPRAASRFLNSNVIVRILDVTISVVIISVAMAVRNTLDSSMLPKALIFQPVFGFADPYYLMTSGYVWLQWLFLFRTLIVVMYSSACGIDLARHWIRAIMPIYGVTFAAFATFQLSTNTPELLGNAFGIYLPCEDIASFGSIIVAMFIYSFSYL
jgi:hypothetical protein